MNYRKAIYPEYSSVSGLNSVLASKYDALVYNFKPLLKDVAANSQVLDIGSGQGEFLELCREMSLEAEGVDVSSELAEACRQRGLKVSLVDDLAEYLRTAGNNWNVVSMIDVLEHFTKEEAVEILTLIRTRVLKTNGRLVLQCPNMQSLFAALNLYHDVTHEWAYTETSIAQLLRSVGFSNVKVYPQNNPPKGRYVIRFALRKMLYLMIHLILIIDQPNRGKILTPNLIAVAEA